MILMVKMDLKQVIKDVLKRTNLLVLHVKDIMTNIIEVTLDYFIVEYKA